MNRAVVGIGTIRRCFVSESALKLHCVRFSPLRSALGGKRMLRVSSSRGTPCRKTLLSSPQNLIPNQGAEGYQPRSGEFDVPTIVVVGHINDVKLFTTPIHRWTSILFIQ